MDAMRGGGWLRRFVPRAGSGAAASPPAGIAAVGIAGALLAGCASPATPAPGPGPGPDQSAAPAAGDPAQGYRPAQELAFKGPTEGMLNDGRVDCTRTATATYSWTLTGQLAGAKLVLRFDTNAFRGAGDYKVSTIADGGVMTMKLNDAGATTDSTHGGTFTVDENNDTGSMTVDLDAPGGVQHISGPWSCTDD